MAVMSIAYDGYILQLSKFGIQFKSLDFILIFDFA